MIEADNAFLSLRQLFRPLRGFHHGFDQSDPQLTFFEFHDPVNRAAGRSGYCVFE